MVLCDPAGDPAEGSCHSQEGNRVITWYLSLAGIQPQCHQCYVVVYLHVRIVISTLCIAFGHFYVFKNKLPCTFQIPLQLPLNAIANATTGLKNRYILSVIFCVVYVW